VADGHPAGCAVAGVGLTAVVAARQSDRMSTGKKVSFHEQLARFTDHWSPKVVGRLNDYEIKVVKLQGEFVWHSHEDTDEVFIVLEGELTIQLRDRDVVLGPQEMFTVPRGVEHCPRADHEVSALLIEPRGVVNTGEAGGRLTAGYESLIDDE
jgi:mannose-6-phosphate isomerase-like protein (cupin superfamily)